MAKDLLQQPTEEENDISILTYTGSIHLDPLQSLWNKEKKAANLDA